MKEAATAQVDYQYATQNKGKSIDMEEEIPLEVENQKFLMQGYKYKIWKLNDSISVCIRCAIHSKIEGSEDLFCNLFVLPEWNPKRQTWTKDIDL